MKISMTRVAVAACVVAFAGTVANATTCANTAVWIEEIDMTSVGADPIYATACEGPGGVVPNNPGAGSVLETGLEDGTFFAGMFDAGLDWTAIKDEESEVTADIDSVVGDWMADFAPAVINNLVVALKGGQEGGALFLFKDLATAGSKFAGGFNMQLAGLVNGNGSGQDLSNFTVAGIFVDGGGGVGGEVPIPATLPLLAGALGLGGFVLKRKRKSA